MLFNSYIFIFFFIIVVPIFFISKKINLTFSKLVLIFFSLTFYSWYNFYFLLIIISSIIVNYTCTLYIFKKKKLKNNNYVLLFCIIFNVTVLIVFKYLDFFIFNLNLLFNENFNLLNLPFPLALSFFTLQQITFIINCNDGEIKKISFINYVNFVTFFPQLIAGPIVLYNQINKNLNNSKNFLSYKNLYFGIFLFAIGLVKKSFFADQLFLMTNDGLNNPGNLNFYSAWLYSFSFTFQIYFDFSGYIDMATGCALILNVKLPQNFNSPYKSTSIIDFWRRWHITLSNFITNFLYFPILNKFKNPSFYKSLFVIILVMCIAGIWHGPRWTYLIFGLIHGIALCINYIFKKTEIKLNKFISWIICFFVINLSFVFFIPQDLLTSLIIFNKMFFLDSSFSIEAINIKLDHIILILISFFITLFFINSNEFFIKKNKFNNHIFLIILIFVCIFFFTEEKFVYFDF